MTDISRFLDTYATQSRLLPSVICVLPPIVSLAAWFPDSYKLATGLMGSIGIVATTLFLAHFSRSRGREVERQLFEKWGGMPTSLWLRHADSSLDRLSKERYRLFLESHIPGWKAPTSTEERDDLVLSIDTYDAATRWLREYTRDTRQHPLIHKENISYGFRRNALGLKWTGVVLATLSVVANVFGSFLYRTNNGELPDAGLAAGTVCAVVLAVWMLVVTEGWVRDAADAYARALLAVCDSTEIMQ